MKMQRCLAWMLAVCMVFLGVCWQPETVKAAEENTQELTDENTSRNQKVTTMDEDGNIQGGDNGAKLIDDTQAGKNTRGASLKVVNFRTKKKEVTNYQEEGTGNAGYTNGAYGADAPYLGSANGKVKFMLSGVVGWVKEEEVQVVDISLAKALSCYEVKESRLVHNIVQDMTTSGYATTLINGPAPSYLAEDTQYYSYDGHYFYTDYGTMVQDYRDNTRSHSMNPDAPYYNYFQYLPFRSQTSYTAEALNGLLENQTSSGSKLRDTGKLFVDCQNEYGVNALLMMGIATNESAWGKSSISQSKNNLFGLNAVDEAPGTSANQYASVQACIQDFANGWMSKGYLYPGDRRYNGGFLGNKASGINVKYASDPYWGEKAANIAWKLDTSLGGRDAEAYTIGMKDTLPTGHISVNVRKENDISSTILYKTGDASNYAVLIKEGEDSDSFYKIQSDGALNETRNGIINRSGRYDFDVMYSYISKDYITVVHNSKPESGVATDPSAANSAEETNPENSAAPGQTEENESAENSATSTEQQPENGGVGTSDTSMQPESGNTETDSISTNKQGESGNTGDSNASNNQQPENGEVESSNTPTNQQPENGNTGTSNVPTNQQPQSGEADNSTSTNEQGESGGTGVGSTTTEQPPESGGTGDSKMSTNQQQEAGTTGTNSPTAQTGSAGSAEGGSAQNTAAGTESGSAAQSQEKNTEALNQNANAQQPVSERRSTEQTQQADQSAASSASGEAVEDTVEDTNANVIQGTILAKTEVEATDSQENLDLRNVAFAASPAKLSYVEGEVFEASGMKIMAEWSDGSKTDVTAEMQYKTEGLTLEDAEFQLQYTAGENKKELWLPLSISAKEEAQPEQTEDMKPKEAESAEKTPSALLGGAAGASLVGGGIAGQRLGLFRRRRRRRRKR